MITLDQHLANNQAEIQADAVVYAKSYDVSFEVALQDVMDEYTNGWYEERSEARFS
jgi:hypothetical protein